MKTTGLIRIMECLKRESFMAILIIMASAMNVLAQLNGTYTIGSGGDYATFSAAATVLHDQGISGPVTFNVLDGTYTEQVKINAIPGSSETNTITFQSQSGDSSKVILQYDSPDDQNNFVLKLNGCNYVTFRGITLRALNLRYSRVIAITQNIEGLTIERCHLRGTMDTNARRRNALIDAENVRIKNFTIRQNRFRRGSYGIFYNGYNTSISNPDISYNRFDSLGYCAIRLMIAYSPVITHNVITYSSYGMTLENVYDAVISYNKLRRINHMGLRCSNFSNTQGNKNVIVNNLISLEKFGITGMEIYGSNNLNIYHNTVYLNYDHQNVKVLWLRYSTNQNIEIVNNNFVTLNNGRVVQIEGNGAKLKRFDYNNFYTTGKTFAFIVDKGTCEDFRTFVEKSGDNAHSVFAWPWFDNEDNLHARSAWLDGAGTSLADVTDDIDGNPRDGTTPDIGCYEFTAPPEAKPKLSGIKTIGQGGNYSTLQEAAEDARIKGISGALKWHFLKGTHEVNCVITPIAGASSANRIIMEPAGGNAEDVTLRHTANGEGDNYLLKIHGASFIHIRKLNFEGLDQRYGLVMLLRGMVDSLMVDSCRIANQPQSDANGGSQLINGDKANFHYMAFRGNRFVNGSTSLQFNLQSNPSLPGAMHITGNTFSEGRYQSLYLDHVPTLFITYNTLNKSSYGMYIGATLKQLEIYNNYVHTEYGRAININQCKLPYYQPGKVYNNFIVCTGDWPNDKVLMIHSSQYVQVLYNSVSAFSNKYKCQPLYINNCSDMVVKNNIFSNQGSQPAMHVQGLNTTPFDYNCLYTEGSVLAYWDQDCADMDALRSASGQNQHSIVADPGFVSDTDLHATSSALDSAATPIPWITTDFDGDMRDAQYPDIGADEMTPMFANQPPVATNDLDTVYQAGVIALDPLKNDSDPDSDSIFFAGIGDPLYGACELDSTNNPPNVYVIYRAPHSDFYGVDSIQYYIRDESGAMDSAWILISIEKINGFTPADENLIQLKYAKVSWSDYDRDGDLDVLMTGRFSRVDSAVAMIYNNKEGRLVAGQVLGSFYVPGKGDMAWTDVNNDGELDVLMIGRYRKDYIPKFFTIQNGAFTEKVLGIDTLLTVSIDWGDYDLDGDMDLVITGFPKGKNPDTYIYKNQTGEISNKPFHLVKTEVSLKGVVAGSANWGDFDNDGDPDLLITGNGGRGPNKVVADIYKNDEGIFSFYSSSLDSIRIKREILSWWRDVDNDGDQDVIISGTDKSLMGFMVFRNVASANGPIFEKIEPIISYDFDNVSSMSFGDYDNDGDLDILLTGAYGEDYLVTKIFINDGEGQFTDSGVNLPEVWGTGVWGDYNGDGKLDILLAGSCYDNPASEIGLEGGVEIPYTGIFLNTSSTTNSAPSVPENLRVEVNDTTVVLRWDASTDKETPSAGLTYNVRVGTSPGGSEIISALADPVTGKLYIPESGNTESNTFRIIKGLDRNTTYYWSVQAVDQGFMASGFASEHSFSPLTAAKHDLTVKLLDDNDQPVTKGLAALISKEANGKYLFRLKEVDGINKVTFTDMPYENYTIMFRPDRKEYPEMLRTYAGGGPLLREAAWFDLKADTAMTLRVMNAEIARGTNKVEGIVEGAEGYPEIWLFARDDKGSIVSYDIVNNMDKENDDNDFVLDLLLAGDYTFDADVLNLPLDPDNDVISISGENKTLKARVALNNTITFKLKGVTAIDDLRDEYGIMVYPNPVSDRLKIRFGKDIDEEVQLILHDLTGRLIRTIRLPLIVSGNEIELPLNDLRNGLYEVAITGRQCYYRDKLLKIDR